MELHPLPNVTHYRPLSQNKETFPPAELLKCEQPVSFIIHPLLKEKHILRFYLSKGENPSDFLQVAADYTQIRLYTDFRVETLFVATLKYT